jgi:hypothetical protein
MPQDARTVLDNVRAKVPGEAKILIAWIDGGVLRLAQANTTQTDLTNIVESLRANLLREKFKP